MIEKNVQWFYPHIKSILFPILPQLFQTIKILHFATENNSKTWLFNRMTLSKGSSNSSGQDKVKLFKNCVKKMVGFVFAQVGVGGAFMCYTIVGASIFQVSMYYDKKIKDFGIIFL